MKLLTIILITFFYSNICISQVYKCERDASKRTRIITKNTPNDYCLEQRQFALGGKYTTYEYSQYGHAYNPAMPCVGRRTTTICNVKR